jgi:hypothetical protein
LLATESASVADRPPDVDECYRRFTPERVGARYYLTCSLPGDRLEPEASSPPDGEPLPECLRGGALYFVMPGLFDMIDPATGVCNTTMDITLDGFSAISRWRFDSDPATSGASRGGLDASHRFLASNGYEAARRGEMLMSRLATRKKCSSLSDWSASVMRVITGSACDDIIGKPQ